MRQRFPHEFPSHTSLKGLGFLYHYGIGVDQNDAEVASWYREAAAQGDEDAKEGGVSKKKEKSPRTRGTVAQGHSQPFATKKWVAAFYKRYGKA